MHSVSSGVQQSLLAHAHMSGAVSVAASPLGDPVGDEVYLADNVSRALDAPNRDHDGSAVDTGEVAVQGWRRAGLQTGWQPLSGCSIRPVVRWSGCPRRARRWVA